MLFIAPGPELALEGPALTDNLALEAVAAPCGRLGDIFPPSSLQHGFSNLSKSKEILFGMG